MKKQLGYMAIALAIVGFDLPLQAQNDVAFFAVFKNLKFEQEDPFLAALTDEGSGDGAISFGVFIATTGPNTVTSATVQPAGGPSVNIPASNGGDNSFNLEQGFDGTLALDTAYPNGDFTVTINTVNDGVRMVTLTLTGDTYPSTPKLANFTAAQSINQAADFTLTWDAFVGGTAMDVILVEVRQNTGNGNNTLLSSPSPGEAGQLTGLSASYTIPAATLAAGSRYEVSIRFIKGVDSDMTYASGLAGYMKETLVEIQTAGSGPADSQPPNLQNINPSFGRSEVADTSVVTFQFNEPMDTGVNVADAITWTGVATPSSFVYTWSPDACTLFCHYPPNHALNTTITWTLNPSGSTAKLRDVAGLNLNESSGNFTTAGTSSAGQTDVRSLFLIKSEFLTQSGSAPVNIGGFGMQAEAELRGFNTASQLEISGPIGGPIIAEPEFGDALELELEYALKADLDAFFPNGSYTNVFTTFNDGSKTIVLDLTPESYPNNPTVQNFSSLSSVDSTIALNLSWDAFTGGTVNDFIQLEIQNDVGRTIFETPGPLEGGHLDGAQTSVSVPAHTLAPGRQYECELTFVKVVDTDTTSYPGVVASAAFAKVTEFNLTTTGAPILPSLSVIGMSNGQFQLRVTGEFKRTYSVQWTQNYSSWMDVITGNTDTAGGNSTGTLEVTDFGSMGQSYRVYRAFEGFSQNQGGGQGNP